MHQLHTTRRQLVKAMLLLGAGTMTASYWHIFSKDKTPFIAGLPDVGDPDHPSLEVFSALSRLVTLHERLDDATMKRMYNVFMDEPWGPQHMSATYAKLRKKLMQKDAVVSLSTAESWFASHILTTWYIGIYYHEKRPTKRITYDKALMLDAVKDWLPIPLLEATGFGNWQHAPGKKI